MAVSQTQVDQIISSASADDPEVKLLKLQDEVDLLKHSIKRLLIDIRERMNDAENPIFRAPPTSDGSPGVSSETLKDVSSAVESAAKAIKATSALQNGREDAQGISAEPSTGEVSEGSPGMGVSPGTAVAPATEVAPRTELDPANR